MNHSELKKQFLELLTFHDPVREMFYKLNYHGTLLWFQDEAHRQRLNPDAEIPENILTTYLQYAIEAHRRLTANFSTNEWGPRYNTFVAGEIGNICRSHYSTPADYLMDCIILIGKQLNKKYVQFGIKLDSPDLPKATHRHNRFLLNGQPVKLGWNINPFEVMAYFNTSTRINISSNNKGQFGPISKPTSNDHCYLHTLLHIFNNVYGPKLTASSIASICIVEIPIKP